MAKADETKVATETRYKVTINTDAGPGGKGDVTLTINGRVTQIKRDVPVLLTRAQLEVLENAEVRGYKATDELGKLVVVPGSKRFSYAVHGEVQVPVGSLDTAPVEETGTAEGGELP